MRFERKMPLKFSWKHLKGVGVIFVEEKIKENSFIYVFSKEHIIVVKYGGRLRYGFLAGEYDTGF